MSHDPSPRARIDARTALELDPDLEAAGFNSAGVLSARRYDSLVPSAWRSDTLLADARSVVVLGCGGRAFGDAFMRSTEARSRSRRHPVDRFTSRVVEEAIARMAQRGISARAFFYWQRRQDQFADFVALGRACGLGSHSRLGLLLHPEFGPWISIRAVVVSQAALAETPAQNGPGPCIGCSAPCATACPGGALADARFDVGACSRTTFSLEACRLRCDARRACVIGREQAYRPELERMFRSAVVQQAGDDASVSSP